MPTATTTFIPAKERIEDPQELTVRLEGVGGRLVALAKEGAGRRIAEPLMECVQELRSVWSSLRQFALVFDANRIETMQDRERELRTAMEILNGTVASLSTVHKRTTAQVDQQLDTLNELDAVDDASLLVGRLRSVGGSLRSAATEMKDDVSRSAAELSQSEDIVQAVERKLDEASHQILCDGLTRVLNRTGFEQRLQELATQPPAVTGSWCVVLIDVDDIEAINSSFGHRVGDALLFRVAGIIQTSCDSYPGAIVGRTGGKQFGIILPRCPLREGRRMAEEVRGAIDGARWECKSAGPRSVVHTTASLGVTERRSSEDADTLLQRAESCLRQAKRAGGNTAVAEG